MDSQYASAAMSAGQFYAVLMCALSPLLVSSAGGGQKFVETGAFC
jgi:hypothetical protein